MRINLRAHPSILSLDAFPPTPLPSEAVKARVHDDDGVGNKPSPPPAYFF